MKKNDLIWVLLTLFVSLTAYLATMNLIVTAAVFVIYTLYYFLSARKKFNQYYSKYIRINSCYHFINSFLVALSVKDSLDEAYESATRLPNKTLQDIIESIHKLPAYDRITYLRGYFNLSIYKMFLNVLDLYQDQGGNVLNYSGNLLRECTRTEKTLTETINIGQKHIFEFILLWVMSFGIVLFMRFGISEFYLSMINNPILIGMLFFYFIICLFSIHIFINKYTLLEIKEDNE